MLIQVLCLIIYLISIKFLYRYIFKELEKFDLYKRIHKYHKQTQDLMNPLTYVNYLK